MNRNVLTFAIGAVLVVVFALLLFVFQVRQSETAVITTFGRPVRNITAPGAYFKWPSPVQRVFIFDDRIQNFEDKFNETLTADQNNLITSVYVGWQISDAAAFLNHFRDGSVPAAQRMLESMLRSANIAVVSKHSLSDFVNADPQALKLNAIENEIEQAVQNELRTNECGIRLEFLGLKRFGLPESVTQTVFDRMKNERLVLINREQYEGERRAQEIKAAADRQAADTIANAEAAATRIKGAGEAEAAKTLPVFQQNPDLAVFLLRIDAIKQSLNQKSTLIFDERTPPFDLFSHLPTNAPAK
ncbi:MAG: protease modulator HflC [Verrucomicrobiota bacterium]|jgi:membrane protease subunit HflC